MLSSLRKFIRENFANENYPLIQKLFALRRRRIMLSNQARHMKMSYSEIEDEINRQYERVFGRKIDWDNPKSFNEKLQVSKLYMPSPLKTKLADKYSVREWVTEKIGGEYLIPLIGVYDSFDEIDFASLPEQFVIKCNHDCGSVTICRDKSKLDIKLLKRKYDILMSVNYAWVFCEMQYLGIKPKILIEPYLGGGLNEYKFYCFDGKPYFCFVTFGQRNLDLSINFYDMNWNLQPFTRPDHKKYNSPAPVPVNYDEMKKIASELCKGFGHVRVDLYSAGEKVYFGEMTFTTARGLGKIEPDEWDYKLGELWTFDNSVRAKVLAEHSRPDWYFSEL